MADTMQFDLVSPERRVATHPARSVGLPAAEGDMTAMPQHLPVITTLRPGVLRVDGPDGHEEYVVTGGFAEIGPESVTVLAEESYHRDEFTQEMLDRLIAKAEEAHRKAQENREQTEGEDPSSDAAKLLSDMMAMGTHIGLSPKQSNL